MIRAAYSYVHNFSVGVIYEKNIKARLMILGNFRVCLYSDWIKIIGHVLPVGFRRRVLDDAAQCTLFHN